LEKYFLDSDRETFFISRKNFYLILMSI